MWKFHRRFGIAAAACVVALCTALPALAEKRVALVVGNSSYVHVPRLTNPANDARLMSDTLRALGFELVGNGPQLDLDDNGFRRAVQNFGQLLQGADVALFYYAGHGVQVKGGNYLVPVGANPTREADVDFQMLDSNLILRQMEGAGTRLNLVVLDACRNNPFGGRGLRATGAGLAQMQAPEGTLISFATQPGNVALDGTGRNSPYTVALAESMKKPGLDIFRTFNEVGLAVSAATNGAQQPWVSLSPIKGDFYFAGLPKIDPPEPKPAPAAPERDPAAQAWLATQNTTSVAVVEEFIRQFGSTVFGTMARARLAELKRAQTVAVAPAAPPPPQSKPAPVVPPTDPAGQAWLATQNTTSVAVVEQFLRQYGTTIYGAMARARLSELKRAELAAAAAPPVPLQVPPQGRPTPAVGVFPPQESPPLGAPAQNTSGPPIKIGVILPYSGPLAAVAQQVDNGIKLYIQKHGAAVAGKRIEIVTRDSRGEPTAAAQAARELIVRDKVDLLAGFAAPGDTVSVSAVSQQHKKLMVVMNTPTTAATQNAPYAVRTSYTLAQLCSAAGTWLVKDGARNSYTMVSDLPVGQECQQSFVRGYRAAGGTLAGSAKMPIGSPDFQAIARTARTSNAQSIFAFVPSEAQALAMLRDLATAGLAPGSTKIIGIGELSSETVRKGLGYGSIGLLTAWHYDANRDSPMNRDFVQAYREAYKGAEPGHAIGGYDGMHTIYEGLKRTGGRSDGDTLLKAVKGLTWESPRGPVRIDPETRDMVQNIYIRRVENAGGQFVNVEFDQVSNVKPK